MRLYRPWFIGRWLYPEAVFRIKTTEKLLCLTFDDGPDPESTPSLLDILDTNMIRVMFFCNGKAAEKYPGLIEKMILKGHLVGNHSYGHIDGYHYPSHKYISDVISAAPFTSGRLFRPPYGHLRPSQYRLLNKSYTIFFWDIMPYDFDRKFGSINSLKIIKRKLRPGSIIVLHDTKCSTSQDFLNDLIGFARSRGYKFILPQVYLLKNAAAEENTFSNDRSTS